MMMTSLSLYAFVPYAFVFRNKRGAHEIERLDLSPLVLPRTLRGV